MRSPPTCAPRRGTASSTGTAARSPGRTSRSRRSCATSCSTARDPCRIVGRPETASLLDAALVNGAAGHALDFDDTNLTMSGHPTVPVLPAVLALADVLGSSGREIVTALVVGTEVEVRLNLVLGGTHYTRGWHTTGTLGVVGAAAACSRLMGSARRRHRHRAGARRHPGRWPEGQLRDDGQAAARRPGGRRRPARRPPRRHVGSPATRRSSSTPRAWPWPPLATARSLAADRRSRPLVHRRDPLQVPRRLLRHARGDQQRARPGSRRAARRRDPRRVHRRHPVVARRLWHRPPGHRVGGQVQPARRHRADPARREHRRPDAVLRCPDGRARPRRDDRPHHRRRRRGPVDAGDDGARDDGGRRGARGVLRLQRAPSRPATRSGTPSSPSSTRSSIRASASTRPSGSSPPSPASTTRASSLVAG